MKQTILILNTVLLFVSVCQAQTDTLKPSRVAIGIQSGLFSIGPDLTIDLSDRTKLDAIATVGSVGAKYTYILRQGKHRLRPFYFVGLWWISGNYQAELGTAVAGNTGLGLEYCFKKHPHTKYILELGENIYGLQYFGSAYNYGLDAIAFGIGINSYSF